MQNTARKSIRQAAYLCDKHRASLVVISPGSRKREYVARSGLKTVGVPDERVAAFTLWGLLFRLVEFQYGCTSGVISSRQASAEAYFQEVQVLILSADEFPPNRLGEGQCICRMFWKACKS